MLNMTTLKTLKQLKWNLIRIYFTCFIIENWNYQQADCGTCYENNRVSSAKPRYALGNVMSIYSLLSYYSLLLALCVWFLAYRAKFSMLNKVSRIRGNTRPVRYPQTEGILGDCMLIYGADLGVETAFGRFISWNKTHYKNTPSWINRMKSFS